jgi:hypothetical protein
MGRRVHVHERGTGIGPVPVVGARGTGLAVVAALAVLAGVGCAPATVKFQEVKVSDAQLAEMTQGAPDYVKPMMATMVKEGQRNETLHHMRIGLAAWERSNRDLAAKHFDAAIGRIETIHADPNVAKQIKNRRVIELAKDFKGEPYERAMAYYYRGLLHLTGGDPYRARACFRAGLVEDMVAEGEDYQCDFALLVYMQGWAARCAGETRLAKESFDLAQKLRPSLKEPPADHNTLVIAESGRSPRKVKDGLGQFQLKFRPGKDFSDVGAVASGSSEGSVRLATADSIYHQSSTRGTREIDHVLSGQAIVFASSVRSAAGTAEMANAVSVTSSAFGGQTGMIGGGIGAGLGLLSAATAASQINNTPIADDRYWNNLPDAVHVGTMKASPGETVRVQFVDANGQPVAGLERSVPVMAAGKTGLAWAKAHATEVPAVATAKK